ncbi:carbamoyltransferase family protein [Microtetraspora niveoalba]|uniref:carbamoyltransferase family protein n=1 Tax=Microtetraspora niveoalba TaxID=46175 RepID=UPI00082A6290|nr:carbamoyltransferase C-terminal domain-containing protein [Microtetraspora niveoalba]
MADVPIVVGVNRTQDGSIAVARGDSEVYSLQKERVSRRKHHWGRLGDLPDRYLPRMPILTEPVDLVVEGYSSDTEIANLGAYRDELRATLDLRPDARIVLVSHHLSHLYSAFPPSPFDRAAGLVVDAQGSRVRDLTEDVDLPPGTGEDMLEVASFYRCEQGRVECLAKQLWDGDWARPAGLGCFYALLTKMLWPTGEGNEGKVMGLAPYGDPDALGLPGLEVRGHEVLIPGEWMRAFTRDRDAYRYVPDGADRFARCANLAAAGQRAFEEALARLAEWLHDRTGLPDLVFAGGTALNCTANGLLIRESPFREVFIPPSPHDGGTAVGCALYGLIACLGRESGFRWTDDFLGPEPDDAEIEAAVRDLPDDLVAERPPDLAAATVELLETGRVVGLHQGRSESGPRALGNRSIIGDPRSPDMRDYINFEVKGREWFRPLAPLVLADHAERIFDVDRPAPFMQYAADVRPPYREGLPAITHVDGTARLQTVEPEATPFLHALLTRWHERTGCPVLVNTSLNGPGDPLTETPEHSIETLRKTNLHALVLPPYLIRKRKEPPVPGEDWEAPAPPVPLSPG